MSILISFTFFTLSIFLSDISSAPLSGRDWMDRCDINEMMKTSTISIKSTTKAPSLGGSLGGLPPMARPGEFIRYNDGPALFIAADDEEVMDDVLKKLQKDAYIRGQRLNPKLRSGFND